jgi:hypothetical protein
MFPLQASHLQHLYLILCNDVDCKEAIYNKKKYFPIKGSVPFIQIFTELLYGIYKWMV